MIQRKSLAAGVALALTAAFAVPQAASAKPHHKVSHHKAKTAKKEKLVPASLKPAYRGQPGFVGGGAGAAPPALLDIPIVAPGTGVLNAGIYPSSGLFKGVPVLSDLGL